METNRRRSQNGKPPEYYRFCDSDHWSFMWWDNPIRIMFRIIFIAFFFLIALSVTFGILGYVLGISVVGWLGNAWNIWGGLWAVLVILFIFSRPWWYSWRGYGSDEAALRVAKIRLARGEITIDQYRKIVNELKRK